MEEKETVRANWLDLLAFTIAAYKIIVPQMLLVEQYSACQLGCCWGYG